MEAETTAPKQQKKRTIGKPFPKGVSGNPNGRPKGSISIKDKVRQYLETHPDDLEKFVDHFVKKNRELAWQMLEGRPQQDVTTAGQKIEIPIYGGRSIDTLPGHDGDKDDIQADKED